MAISDRTAINTVPTVADRTSDAPASAPASVGRYELGPLLGAGGMGVVHVARDPELRREVALKLIRPAKARARTEARAMARIQHPNVVTVYDAGVADDVVYIAMELVRGPSMRRYLELHPSLSAEKKIALFVGAGRGLAAAHAASVVHRDFKPENVLVALEGVEPRARVTDFGLARPAHADEADPVDAAPPASNGHAAWVGEPVTRGVVKGTPRYMAPEQIDGGEVDARADQFAFAVALYEALWGKKPFGGATFGDRRAAMTRGPTPPPESRSIPSWVWPLLERALRAKPEERYPSMVDLVDALERGEAHSAEMHITAHVLFLGAMFFLHLTLAVVVVWDVLSATGDAPPLVGIEWLEVVALTILAIGWVPLGLVAAPLNAWGLWRRQRWAYATTFIYAITALVAVVGIPYGAFALWSLRRPAVRAALGRAPRKRA
jgi:hypothetical protein